MFKKLRKPFWVLMLSLLAGSGSMLAKNSVKLESEGKEVVCELSSRPKIRFEAKTIVLTADDVTVTYALTNPVTVQFVDDVVPPEDSGVDSAIGDLPRYKVTNEVIEVSGHSADVPVMVYDTAGRLAASGRTDANGSATVSISSLDKGVHVVVIESTTFKFQKK